MADKEQAALSFQFRGGDADDGELNFYDASRFYYGAARFVYTLEYFRQTDQVLSKITKRVNAEYRVRAPREGSWIVDVLHIAGPVIAEMSVKVPLHVLMAFVIEKLTPGKKSRETLVRLAQEATAQEREKTAQERERTKQLRLASQGNEQALDLIGALLKERDRSDAELLRELRSEIVASRERERLIQIHQGELSKIPDRTVERLLTRTQSQVVEIGKPLIRSASELSISGGTEATSIVASLNRRSVEHLSGNEVDPLPTSLLGSVVRYDKENGWGKFRSDEFSAPVSFVVPSTKKNALNLDVIEAMKEDKVEVVFYYVRDRRRVVKYLVFDSILASE